MLDIRSKRQIMKKILVLFALIFVSATSSASASSFYYSSSPIGFYDSGFNISIGTGYSPIYSTGCTYTSSPYIYSNVYGINYCPIGLGINYVYRRHHNPPPPPRHHVYHSYGPIVRTHIAGPHGGGPHSVGHHHVGPHHGGPHSGGPHGGGHRR